MRPPCLVHSIALAIFSACSTVAIAAAQGSDYEVRSFDGGPGWFIYEGPVEVALHVLRAAEPKCHEIGEIVLLFKTRAQLRDPDLIEAAGHSGMARYAELCRALGGRPSNQRKVFGVIAGEAEPDARGRVLGDARVLDAMVSSMTGDFRVTVRRNAAVSEDSDTGTVGILADRDEKLAVQRAQKDSGVKRRAEARAAQIADVRTRYDAALAQSMANARPAGRLGRLAGGKRAALSGVWGGSQAECARERLILFEAHGLARVEWWRATSPDIGLLPWRSGQWELRDETIVMSFDHRVEYDDFLGRMREGPVEETLQFDLASVTESALRLGATGGGISHKALFLNGAEKLFVRCND